jgi:iron complex outermembrane receptor protein
MVRSAPSDFGRYLPEVPMTSLTQYALTGLAVTLLMIAACRSGQRAESNPPAPTADITSEEIERVPGQSLEQLLEGRVSGVTVTQTSNGIAVRIRGVSSFYGSNEPLYVLDDVPVTPGPGGTLTGIDPHDIESIRVLKDPADTALYGMRGANGVILIKTKRAMLKKSSS